MKFYVVNCEVNATFDICVEAEGEQEARSLARDEAKKRVKSPTTLYTATYEVRESDEK